MQSLCFSLISIDWKRGNHIEHREEKPLRSVSSRFRTSQLAINGNVDLSYHLFGISYNTCTRVVSQWDESSLSSSTFSFAHLAIWLSSLATNSIIPVTAFEISSKLSFDRLRFERSGPTTLSI